MYSSIISSYNQKIVMRAFLKLMLTRKKIFIMKRRKRQNKKMENRLRRTICNLHWIMIRILWLAACLCLIEHEGEIEYEQATTTAAATAVTTTTTTATITTL